MKNVDAALMSTVKFLLDNQSRLDMFGQAKFIGIDPGISGAIFVFSGNFKVDEVILIEKFLDQDKKIITEKLVKFLENYAISGPFILVQELPNIGAPGVMSRSAMGKLMQMTYQMRGIIETFFSIYYWISQFKMLIHFLRPNDWYQYCGIGPDKDSYKVRKDKTIDFVQSKFQLGKGYSVLYRTPKCKGPDHNICDAAAIAYCGWKLFHDASAQIQTYGIDYWKQKFENEPRKRKAS